MKTSKPTQAAKLAALTFLIDATGLEANRTQDAARAAGLRWLAGQLTKQQVKLMRWPGGRPSEERLRNCFLLVGATPDQLNGDERRTLDTAVRDALLTVEENIIRPGVALDVNRAAGAAARVRPRRPITKKNAGYE